MIKQLTFITGNPGKVAQIKRYLNFPIKHVDIDLDEIQSLEVEEIVKHKAEQAFNHVQKPIFVEDNVLVCHALGKLPGTFIKWFIKEIGNDGICKMLQPFKDRSATAIVCVGLYDGNNFYSFKGLNEGSIAEKPSGTNGFGWDQIFIPKGYNLTRANMNEQDYDATSPRKKALDQLAEFLKTGGKNE
ncbi:MAG: non-canonical purine NTP pyrophosphatase [Candidatus Daviesbacteria bacterium]|nr:non-canonical purine NTP pyrophosphatase [Candidatus Daviesbacteria bacterium]